MVQSSCFGTHSFLLVFAVDFNLSAVSSVEFFQYLPTVNFLPFPLVTWSPVRLLCNNDRQYPSVPVREGSVVRTIMAELDQCNDGSMKWVEEGQGGDPFQ